MKYTVGKFCVLALCIVLTACSPLTTLYPDQDLHKSSGLYFVTQPDATQPGVYIHVLPVVADRIFLSGPWAGASYQLEYLNFPAGSHDVVLRVISAGYLDKWLNTERDLSRLNTLPLNQITEDGFIRLQLELNPGYIYLFAPDIADGKVRGVLQRKI